MSIALEYAPLILKCIVIIQARMGSKRFPGKTMYPFFGKPSLDYLLDSVQQSLERSLIYVATSRSVEDNPISEFCQQHNIAVFRGDPKNVASRFYSLLQSVESEFFIRLNADSPLLDYRVIDRAKMLVAKNVDLISTSIERQYPKGMNVEIVNSSTFLDNYSKFSKPEHFEHVTGYFYENRVKFNIVTFQSPITQPEKFNFCFDTPEDKDRLENMFRVLDKPHYYYTLQEKCKIYERLFFS